MTSQCRCTRSLWDQSERSRESGRVVKPMTHRDAITTMSLIGSRPFVALVGSGWRSRLCREFRRQKPGKYTPSIPLKFVYGDQRKIGRHNCFWNSSPLYLQSLGPRNCMFTFNYMTISFPDRYIVLHLYKIIALKCQPLINFGKSRCAFVCPPRADVPDIYFHVRSCRTAQHFICLWKWLTLVWYTVLCVFGIGARNEFRIKT